MIFTAYLDESGTHAGALISAMGGFVGDARQWHKFEKRAGKLFKRFRVEQSTCGVVTKISKAGRWIEKSSSTMNSST